MISVNTNLSALNTAHILTSHYGRLQTSTQRLSSGLRINNSADDAAGLAIRELMRADIAALNQGVRNANDAISMLQTFDGALAVIDEKLIRMKELAEQAATGTYDSTQRLMIDSEFQAMGSEINRIANATDFNGVKLLCTPMVTKYRDVTDFFVTDSGSITNLNASAGLNPTVNVKITEAQAKPAHINAANPTKTISINLAASSREIDESGRLGNPVTSNINGGTLTTFQLGNSEFSVAFVSSIGTTTQPKINYDGTSWSIVDGNDPNYTYRTDSISPGDISISGSHRDPNLGYIDSTISFSMTKTGTGRVDFSNFKADNPDIVKMTVDSSNNSYTITRNVIEIGKQVVNPEYSATYDAKSKTVSIKFTNGGTASVKLDNALKDGDTLSFDVNLEGETKTIQQPYQEPDPDQKLTIHFGTMNDSAEDYYNIGYENCTLVGLGIDGIDIKTQDNAQNALVDINGAIVKKDQVRAKFGAMQNRLENTVTNLTTQAENLEASESRISDADIATEMMNFVRNQILTNSAVTMLAQANSFPQMALSLIQ